MSAPHPCENQPPIRQAVLLIHGIGEQMPMHTLREFVDALWRPELHPLHEGSRKEVWSKPDLLSESFELRRLTTDYNASCIRTDFFEFYWAHLMEGTHFLHVLSWARRTLWRLPWNVPRPLLPSYFVLWLLFCAVSTVLILLQLDADRLGVALPSGVAVVITLSLGLAWSRVIKPVIGDAARYLSPNPTNVKVRHDILHAGTTLLRKLHALERDDGQPRYDRIIVVGHSLGSVIGYDVLAHTWHRYNTEYDRKAPPQNDTLHELEELARQIVALQPRLSEQPLRRGGWARPSEDLAHLAERYREKQREYFEALRQAGGSFRVTDFVTLGSPLTYADVILAEGPADLAKRQGRRELLTCPPTLERDHEEDPGRFSYRPPAALGNAFAEERWLPNFASAFAPVRWTNLYFPARAVLWGDVVGGPLGGAFGYGIRDVALPTRKGFRLLSHTKYWALPKSEKVSDESAPHLFALCDALALAERAAPRVPALSQVHEVATR